MPPMPHPTRRKALQLAAGSVAMAALPVPALTRLQTLAGPIGPSANVLWRPAGNALRVAMWRDDPLYR
jgi:hypothetical protein